MPGGFCKIILWGLGYWDFDNALGDIRYEAKATRIYIRRCFNHRISLEKYFEGIHCVYEDDQANDDNKLRVFVFVCM